MTRVFRMRTLCRAAVHGAEVWSLYGITETAAVIAVPLLRRCVGMLIPSLGPSQAGPFTTPMLTATALVAYPMLGALLGGLVAICVGRRFTHLSTEKSRYLWLSMGGVTLAVVFGANGLIAHQYYCISRKRASNQ